MSGVKTWHQPQTCQSLVPLLWVLEAPSAVGLLLMQRDYSPKGRLGY